MRRDTRVSQPCAADSSSSRQSEASSVPTLLCACLTTPGILHQLLNCPLRVSCSTVPTWFNLLISYGLPCLVVVLLRASTCRQKPGLGWTNVYTDITNLFFWGFTAQVKLQ